VKPHFRTFGAIAATSERASEYGAPTAATAQSANALKVAGKPLSFLSENLGMRLDAVRAIGRFGSCRS
jgi:hypothetical protein